MASVAGGRASILETIGEDIVGVMAPVSVCMLTVVLTVCSLSSPTTTTVIRTAANLVYDETHSDSITQKLEGSILNAAVFVAIITATTFLLFALYYHNYTSLLTHYTRLSTFFILSLLAGPIFLSLLRRFSLPLDALSAALLLLNFASLGSISLFSPASPILLRQFFSLAIAAVAAVSLSRLPEWTTWSLLLSLSVYDLFAVLSPKGPLKLLVELAVSRNQSLPALVYECRPPPPPLVELQPLRPHHDDDGDDQERSQLVLDRHEADDYYDGDDDDGDNDDVDKGIKLGLGDFIFYSVMVGRAAMYDLMTVYACYLAIVAGLGCTLILLSVYRRALPALPISIVLGAVFYFLTRLVMEPFIVGAATNLLMF